MSIAGVTFRSVKVYSTVLTGEFSRTFNLGDFCLSLIEDKWLFAVMTDALLALI